MSINEQSIQEALKTVVDPNTGKDLVSTRSAKNIKISGSDVALDIELGYPAKSQIEGLRAAVIAQLKTLPGIGNISANVYSKVVTHAVQKGVKLIPGVKNIVAVASGKGGVGKSTTAVNLALALAAEGATVGLLDADIYGPSLPQMLGIASGRPESADVDYLVIDMPPGTGDIQLTLAQQVPVTGAVIVTTPQDIALLDARKGLKMFEKVGIPILGIVENMSVHICSKCGHAEPIFGAGGGDKMAKDYEVEMLGALPLDMAIRMQMDDGKPTVEADPQGPASLIYKTIARRIAVKIAERAKDHSSKFPSIKVMNT